MSPGGNTGEKGGKEGGRSLKVEGRRQNEKNLVMVTVWR
jgi:hypothetical protein